MAHNHEKITYGMDDVKELFDAGVLTGTIVEVDTDNDKAHVNISGFGQINDVPIFYHCPGSSVVEGGSVAFSEGDSVYILDKEGKASPGAADLQIVGFVDGLKSCIWEPWTGPDITTNHPWQIVLMPDWADPPVGVATLELTENGLYAHTGGGSWGWVYTDWHSWYLPSSPNPVGLIMKLKISANITGSPLGTSCAFIKLSIYDEFYNCVHFAIALTPGFEPGWVYIGDNGGEEQEIDLASYGLSGSIIIVRMDAEYHSNWTVDYVWRHIHFTN